MIDTPSAPKAREGAWLWMFKIFAGVMIVIILGVHFFVNHLVAPSGLLSYADVIAYYDNPWIVIMEIVFLIFVVSHALVGMRSIVLDLNPSDRALRLVDRALFVLGAAAIAYGTWLALIIASR
jgi:succinate dehydrogenase / fumarate reductase membrane anchor subunit